MHYGPVEPAGPFHEACKGGDSQKVRAMLAGPDDSYSMEETDAHGNSCFLAAVSNGDIAIAALLLDAGADPSARTTASYDASYVIGRAELRYI